MSSYILRMSLILVNGQNEDGLENDLCSSDDETRCFLKSVSLQDEDGLENDRCKIDHRRGELSTHCNSCG